MKENESRNVQPTRSISADVKDAAKDINTHPQTVKYVYLDTIMTTVFSHYIIFL